MTEKGLAAVIADLIADEYLRFTAEQVKLRSEAERLKVDVDELHEERFRLMAERDALRAEAQHLRDARAEAELAHIRERDSLLAEVEMLRGVGCMEDGDGQCGACLKCARSALLELADKAPLFDGHSQFVAAQVSTARALLEGKR